jgi:hypothetical protein
MNETITRYSVLDVREYDTCDGHVLVIICKEHDAPRRRRIELRPSHKVYTDAQMVVPGDYIVVHDTYRGVRSAITEIEL